MKRIFYLLLLVMFSGYNVYSGDNCNFKIYAVNYTGSSLYIDVDAETWSNIQMTDWDFEIYMSGANLYIKPNFVSSVNANLVNHDGNSNFPVYNLNDISCVAWLPGNAGPILLNTANFPVDASKYGLFWTTRGGWSRETIHQGWIEIVHNADNTFTLLNYGYSLNPNTSIQVGTDLCNPCGQKVVTGSASSVTHSSATVSGRVIGKGTAVHDISFEYGTTPAYGNSVAGNPSTVDGSENADISADLSGLTSDTTYYFRINAKDDFDAVVFGSDSTFTTTGLTSQTITFNELAPKIYGDNDFDPGAIASSELPVMYSSSNTDIAAILDNVVHIAGAGHVIIYADQAGDETFAAAPQVSRNLIINKKELDVTAIDEIKTQGDVNPGFTLTYVGFIDAGNDESIDTLPVASCSADNNSIAGDYDIVLAGGSDNNYSLVLHNGILTVNLPTGISESKAALISVYPNPVCDYMYIKNLPERTTVRIFNIQGLLVKSVMADETEKINVNELPAGVYILKLGGISGEKIVRFIKR